MIFGVRIGRVSRDNMAYPAQHATRANPEAGRDNEPQDARQNSAVIELAHTGNKEA